MKIRSLLIAVMHLIPSPALAASWPDVEIDSDSVETRTNAPPLAPDRDRFGWAVPDFVRLQTGGFSGMFTLGSGYSAFRDILNVGVLYGYVPPSGSAPPVHLGTALVQVRPLRATLGAEEEYYFYPLYVGAGGSVASGKNLFLKQPSSYPPGYYPATGFHYLFLVGTELDVRMNGDAIVLRHALFAELVTIDEYFDALTANRRSSLTNGIATAVGYRAAF